MQLSMTPIVTGISGSFNIVGCGAVSKINNRRLDTGAIRIKNGETLVLTGVIQETDVDQLINILYWRYSFIRWSFKSKKNLTKKKLIILVTPKVLEENSNNLLLMTSNLVVMILKLFLRSRLFFSIF